MQFKKILLKSCVAVLWMLFWITCDQRWQFNKLIIMQPQHYSDLVHKKEKCTRVAQKAGNTFETQNNWRVRKIDNLVKALATLNQIGINQSHLPVTKIQRHLICPYPNCYYKIISRVKIHDSHVELISSHYQINKDEMKCSFFRRKKNAISSSETHWWP